MPAGRERRGARGGWRARERVGRWAGGRVGGCALPGEGGTRMRALPSRTQIMPADRRHSIGGRVLIFGHVRFGAVDSDLPRSARPPNYIAAVREPVAACVSMFRYAGA